MEGLLAQIVDESWWDTNGASVLLAGAISVTSLAVGFALQPIVQRRVRRQEQHEDWLQEARQVAADLSTFLFDGITDESVEWWRNDLRRRTVLLAHFAPDSGVREAAEKLWNEIERLRMSRRRMRGMPSGPHKSRLEQRELEATGEANYQLDALVERLGGPAAPPRDSYFLPLRGEDREHPAEDEES